MRVSHWSAACAAVVAALTIGAGACTDPTVAPKSTVTGANFFADPSAYQQVLAKIYAGLAVGGQSGGDGSTDISGIDGGFSQYMRLYWEMEELPTDEAVIAWGDQTLPEMNTQGWSASNTFVNAMYYRVYFQVQMVNEFLRQTTDAALASRGVSAPLKAKIHTYRAEARFMRALSYWHGLDFFGGIPLATENDALGANPPAQVTRTQLYNYVVGELTAIRDSLPVSGVAPDPATYGRATKGAADMLLAELYLNAGVYTGVPDYADALTSAQNVISSGLYSLNPVYRNNFTADNNNSPEIIFAVAEDGQHTQTYGSTNFIIHASCGNSMNPGNYGVDGCWYGLRMKPSAFRLYNAGDSRGSTMDTLAADGQTIAIPSISSFGNGIPNPKFTNKTSAGATGSNPAFADTDFPMFRLAEAYLIYVEAHLRSGGGTDANALNYFNALRVRAYGDSSAVDTSIAEITLDTVLAERGRELMWEAHRRTDLVRYGLFAGPLSGNYVWAWKGANAYGTDSTGMATDAHLNLYPIPANELIANPKVKQNTGY
ncbi:MAG TPA: RagB/SusD family nutrient uptake outer membrane protein [Gemmatimonadales bacterium]|nr:RagB/SusD family nutrient uptake outer membrane protein [Gemmatimonadales bacterium]